MSFTKFVPPLAPHKQAALEQAAHALRAAGFSTDARDAAYQLMLKSNFFCCWPPSQRETSAATLADFVRQLHRSKCPYLEGMFAVTWLPSFPPTVFAWVKLHEAFARAAWVSQGCLPLPADLPTPPTDDLEMLENAVSGTRWIAGHSQGGRSALWEGIHLSRGVAVIAAFARTMKFSRFVP